jgi:hypothetical protein
LAIQKRSKNPKYSPKTKTFRRRFFSFTENIPRDPDIDASQIIEKMGIIAPMPKMVPVFPFDSYA